MALARYDADGSPDPGFFRDGTETTRFTHGDLERADHSMFLLIAGRHVRPRHHRLRFMVFCPLSELSPPCAGRFTVATAHRVRFHGHRRHVVFGSQSFSKTAGKSRRIILRLSSSQARLIRRNRAARNVRAIARVHDASGNHARRVKRMRLVPAT